MANRQIPPVDVVDVALAQPIEIDISTLASELLDAFGGPAKLAQAYSKEFDAGKQGGMARQRLLEGVLRTVSQASAQRKDQLSVENLSPSELEDQLWAILARKGIVPASTESAGNGPGQMAGVAA